MRHPSVLAVTALCAAGSLAAAPAAADTDDDRTADSLTAGSLTAGRFDERQVALAADVGLSGGGVGTPGGLRVGGRYLYRLADRDWFDGGLSFTFGGAGDACLPASDGAASAGLMPCDRAVTDGFAGDLALGVRRELAPRQGITPWLRLAGFVRALRFDDVGGFAAGGELGAGVRAPVHGELAVVAGAHAFLGATRLAARPDAGHQLGLTVTVGAEVGLR